MRRGHSLFWGALVTAARTTSRASFISSSSSSKGATHLSPSSSNAACTATTRNLSTTISMTTRISISDAFDGGNIDKAGDMVVDRESNSLTVPLLIKPDVYTELEKKFHSQYFCFRSTIHLSDDDETGTASVTYSIENAAQVSYPDAWKGSTVFFSNNLVDPNAWRRNVNTTYKDGKLRWTHEHKRNESIYFSYFPPFPYTRHLDLIAKCTSHPQANVVSLGQSLDGREMECIQVGEGERVAWIIHRQHPGESMAAYYAEGLLTRLLGFDTNGEVDGMVRQLLKLYTFYIVPCMCPDGAIRGHLRTNAAGANLNREWHDNGDYKAPSLERSPEVYWIWKKMEETGVDLFLDVHGDEELPVNFLSGAEGTVNWGPRLESLHGAFLGGYVRANSDMQKAIGYTPASDAPSNIATNAVANRFDCLSITLEMPFKDCMTNPDPDKGWSPNRSRMLGASALDALAYIQPYLRAEGEFWKSLSADDAYITPTSTIPVADS